MAGSPDCVLDPDRPADAAGGPDAAARGQGAGLDLVAEGVLTEEELYGTINCDGINAAGEICGVTTTSGLAWKIPGRVGDSPILGAGLYVDGAVGAAGSTGRGEANLYSLASFLIVEQMRAGAHPLDAAMEALNTVGRLLDRPPRAGSRSSPRPAGAPPTGGRPHRERPRARTSRASSTVNSWTVGAARVRSARLSGASRRLR